MSVSIINGNNSNNYIHVVECQHFGRSLSGQVHRVGINAHRYDSSVSGVHGREMQAPPEFVLQRIASDNTILT